MQLKACRAHLHKNLPRHSNFRARYKFVLHLLDIILYAKFYLASF